MYKSNSQYKNNFNSVIKESKVILDYNQLVKVSIQQLWSELGNTVISDSHQIKKDWRANRGMRGQYSRTGMEHIRYKLLKEALMVNRYNNESLKNVSKVDPLWLLRERSGYYENSYMWGNKDSETKKDTQLSKESSENMDNAKWGLTRPPENTLTSQYLIYNKDITQNTDGKPSIGLVMNEGELAQKMHNSQSESCDLIEKKWAEIAQLHQESTKYTSIENIKPNPTVAIKFKSLPTEINYDWNEAEKNSYQIALMVYLQAKIKQKSINTWGVENSLNIVKRPSFGFNDMTLTETFNCPPTIRINPGLYVKGLEIVVADAVLEVTKELFEISDKKIKDVFKQQEPTNKKETGADGKTKDVKCLSYIWRALGAGYSKTSYLISDAWFVAMENIANGEGLHGFINALSDWKNHVNYNPKEPNNNPFERPDKPEEKTLLTPLQKIKCQKVKERNARIEGALYIQKLKVLENNLLSKGNKNKIIPNSAVASEAIIKLNAFISIHDSNEIKIKKLDHKYDVTDDKWHINASRDEQTKGIESLYSYALNVVLAQVGHSVLDQDSNPSMLSEDEQITKSKTVYYDSGAQAIRRLIEISGMIIAPIMSVSRQPHAFVYSDNAYFEFASEYKKIFNAPARIDDIEKKFGTDEVKVVFSDPAPHNVKENVMDLINSDLPPDVAIIDTTSLDQQTEKDFIKNYKANYKKNFNKTPLLLILVCSDLKRRQGGMDLVSDAHITLISPKADINNKDMQLKKRYERGKALAEHYRREMDYDAAIMAATGQSVKAVVRRLNRDLGLSLSPAPGFVHKWLSQVNNISSVNYKHHKRNL